MDTVLSKLSALDINREDIINNLPIISVTTAASVSLATYLYYKHKFSYWKKLGVPGPEPQIPLGNFRNTHKSLPEIIIEWAEEYDKVYGAYNGVQPTLVIGEPELVKEVLIKNFHKFTDRRSLTGHKYSANSLINQNGGQWKHDRSIMSQTFSSGKMKHMYPLMKESYVCLENEFERLAGLGDEVDIKNVFVKLTTMVIARCAFATHVDAFKDPNNELLKNLQAIFRIDRVRVIGHILLPEFVKKLIGFSVVNPNALNYIGAVCSKILEHRKHSQGQVNEYTDLLQLLLETNTNGGQGFNDLKIIANSILFFNAGYETTSTLLTWASYALAMNPQVQETLHREVKEAKESKGNLDYETLFELKYLDAVINETLRLYPPVPVYDRVATEDHTFSTGIIVKKGFSIRIPAYALHLDKDNFAEPHKFDPERFMPENKDFIKTGSFVPFVIGPRNCIGMRFALLEAKMTLAELVCKYKFVKSENTPEKVTFAKNSFILTMDHYKVKIVKRN